MFRAIADEQPSTPDAWEYASAEWSDVLHFRRAPPTRLMLAFLASGLLEDLAKGAVVGRYGKFQGLVGLVLG